MKRAVLVTPLTQSVFYEENVDYIGVDAGVLLLKQSEIQPKFAVGDFDSMDERLLQSIDCKIYKHPIMKNETDTELAIRLCVQQRYQEIIVLGALSGRLDHTLANIRLLMYSYPQVVFQDEMQRICCFDQGTYDITREYQHISFFAVETSKISLIDFLYPLDHQSIEPSDIYTVSNELTEEKGSVIVHSGRILCVQSNIK